MASWDDLPVLLGPVEVGRVLRMSATRVTGWMLRGELPRWTIHHAVCGYQRVEVHGRGVVMGEGCSLAAFDAAPDRGVRAAMWRALLGVDKPELTPDELRDLLQCEARGICAELAAQACRLSEVLRRELEGRLAECIETVLDAAKRNELGVGVPTGKKPDTRRRKGRAVSPGRGREVTICDVAR